MSEFDWSPFGSGGDSVKFESIGDEIVGKIVSIRRVASRDKEKGDVPVIDLERKSDGEKVSLWVDKVDLRRKIADIAPQAGDMLAVKFIDTEKSDKGSPMKLFVVKHKPGERASVSSYDADPFDGSVAPLNDYSEEPF